MKSPQELAARLAQHWNNADWRERQLLGAAAAWPLTLAIGQPDTAVFLSDAAALRIHLQQWRAVEQHGLGSVQWQARRYRGSSDAIAVPTHWQLAKPSQCVAALSHFKAPGHAQVKSDYTRLSTLIAAVERPGFQRLLVRRLVQWRDVPTEAVITAARIALDRLKTLERAGSQAADAAIDAATDDLIHAVRVVELVAGSDKADLLRRRGFDVLDRLRAA